MLISETHKDNFQIYESCMCDTKEKIHDGTAILITLHIKHYPLEEYWKEYRQMKWTNKLLGWLENEQIQTEL